MQLTPMDAIVSPMEELDYFLRQFLHSPLFPVFVVVLLLVIAAIVVSVLRVRAAQLKNSLEMKAKADEPQSAPDDEPSCNS